MAIKWTDASKVISKCGKGNIGASYCQGIWETDAHESVYLTFDATTCSTVTENPGLREMNTAGDREAKSEGQQWIVVRWISLALRVNTVALQVNFNQFCSQLCACSLTPLKNMLPPHWPLDKYSIK